MSRIRGTGKCFQRFKFRLLDELESRIKRILRNESNYLVRELAKDIQTGFTVTVKFKPRANATKYFGREANNA